MAESIAHLADRLTSMLVGKILQEASLAINFRKDLKFICDELQSIKCLINDTRGTRNSCSMSNWLQKVQDFLYDAVDIVENTSQQHNNIISRFLVGRKIRMLKDRLQSIHRSSDYLKYLTYMDVQPQSTLINGVSVKNRKRLSGLLMDGDPVGMQDDIDKIVTWLSADGHRILAVAGMGGLGKTLLLKQVSQRIKDSFDHFIWVEVSQSFVPHQLLQLIAGQIELPDERRQNHVSEVELKANISRHLERKTCLLVLDDVWETEELQLISSWDNKDIKLMISTRHRRVAQNMGAQYTHDMEYLSPENSWKLFCMLAFPHDTDHSPPKELEEMARAIERKCSRLPLTVKTVAASMASVSRLPNEWESTLNRLNQVNTMKVDVLPIGLDQVNKIKEDILQILRLSFDALPDDLKPCFLFCSAYPEDTRMSCEYLVQVWIAEGFVDLEETQDPYEMGRLILNQLVDRCMIEFVPYDVKDDSRHDFSTAQDVNDGMISYCKMHDLLQELALRESHKQTGCLYQAGKNLSEIPVDECRGLRRISFTKNKITRIDQTISSRRLRTLLLWNNLLLDSISPEFFSKLTHLRVLDLSQTSIRSLPRSIAKLTRLRLLNLSRTKIDMLPSWLSALTSLQFLDVGWCENLTTLHSGIGKHQCLLHLKIKSCTNLKFVPVGVSKLVSLRKLGQVVFKGNAANELQLMHLKGLTMLQKLSILISGSQGLPQGIFGEMTQMRDFFFQNSEDFPLRLPDDMEVMRRLEILHLRNCMLPAWISQLHNLMVLVLKGDHSANYKPLQTMPNLQRVILLQNNQCTEFPTEFWRPPSFPKLESFIIQDFSLLTRFPSVEDNAMPVLKYFRLQNCSRLEGLPQGLDRLNSLQELKVIGIEACKTDLQENGRYWKIFKQRNIKFSCE